MSSGTMRNEYVESFARGLKILSAFDRDHTHLTLAAVSKRTGQTRATARRFLMTLCHLGYAETVDSLFRLTPKVLEFGSSYLAASALPDIARPIMAEMVAQVKETSSLGVLNGTDVFIIAYAASPRLMSLRLDVGDRLPAFTSAQGRVMLSALPTEDILILLDQVDPESLRAHDRDYLLEAVHRTRQQGYSVVDQEIEEGVRSIGVPITNAEGRTIAAMTLCAHANRASVKELEARFLPVLRKYAGRINETFLAQSGQLKTGI